jgi:hypothetical protein
MKDKHIIDILDKSPLASLNESDRAVIEDHSSDCPDCQQALEAAYVSAALVREHAAESFTPSHFFETRVLAVLRERQTAKAAWGLGRMWRAAGALVSSMAVTVATLAVISFVVPGSETTIQQDIVSVYSADEMILGQIDLSDDQVTDGQVLNTLYEAEEETAK